MGGLIAKLDNVPFVEAQERIRIDIFMREICREEIEQLGRSVRMARGFASASHLC